MNLFVLLQTSALWASGCQWQLQQTYTPNTKIKGRSLMVHPIGSTYIRFSDSEDVYTYGKVPTSTSMTNIVSGKLQTEIIGEILVCNVTQGDKCLLKFHEQSYFSRDAPRKVTGTVVDRNERAHYAIDAIWDKHAILQRLDVEGGAISEKLAWKVHPLP
jgi:hypothetical protein